MIISTCREGAAPGTGRERGTRRSFPSRRGVESWDRAEQDRDCHKSLPGFVEHYVSQRATRLFIAVSQGDSWTFLLSP